MHESTGHKSAHCTYHVTFGKDDNIFSNYKQNLVKIAENSEKRHKANKFNILIRFY